jgi:hypothetical protein
MSSMLFFWEFWGSPAFWGGVGHSVYCIMARSRSLAAAHRLTLVHGFREEWVASWCNSKARESLHGDVTSIR